MERFFSGFKNSIINRFWTFTRLIKIMNKYEKIKKYFGTISIYGNSRV
ncbi:hypothetical protein SAMN05443667_105262 [Flavobacterium gillisiae]|uniref:Uncharacterized protein n=1 Tax=Flavobacterium gillisiae TaxID=150146 RepID=A0A1H4C7N0_9FLAO|nr:hypothetical protein SAMN05443667_105262 [Flavobacterium gillisiae]